MFTLETRVNGFGGCLGAILMIVLVIVGISLFQGETKNDEKVTNTESSNSTEEDKSETIAVLSQLKQGMSNAEVNSVIGYMDHGDIIQIYDKSYKIRYGWLPDGSRITILMSYRDGLVDYFEGVLDAQEVKEEFEKDRGY